MEPKEMRKALKEAGITCPIKNEQVVVRYNEYFDENGMLIQKLPENPENIVKLVSNNMFTYIGQGDAPPHRINFMGRQWFVRGELTEVKDPDLLAKIKTNPCFVNGPVDKDEMYAQDDIEKEKAEKRREEDLKIQIEMDRINKA